MERGREREREKAKRGGTKLGKVGRSQCLGQIGATVQTLGAGRGVVIRRRDVQRLCEHLQAPANALTTLSTSRLQLVTRACVCARLLIGRRGD